MNASLQASRSLPRQLAIALAPAAAKSKKHRVHHGHYAAPYAYTPSGPDLGEP